MAKFTLFLATFTLVLLAANASIYRTTVVVEDEESQGSQQRCRQQIEQQQQLRQCQTYLQQRISQQSPYDGNQGSQRQYLQQCCNQLEQMDTRCRCPGLKEAARYQESQQQYGDQERQQLYQIAQNIPQMCGVQPMRCDFSGGYDI